MRQKLKNAVSDNPTNKSRDITHAIKIGDARIDRVTTVATSRLESFRGSNSKTSWDIKHNRQYSIY